MIGCFIIIYLQCPCLTDFMNYLIHAMPVHHPYAYSIPSYCLLLLLLPLLFYYCCYCFTTITTMKLLLLINRCEQVYFQVQLN
jgi:hypothetical protein